MVTLLHRMEWFIEFCCGRTSRNDGEQPGFPNEVTTEEIVNTIHNILLDDRRLKITKMVNILKE